jgi:hypothetical protein
VHKVVALGLANRRPFGGGSLNSLSRDRPAPQ